MASEETIRSIGQTIDELTSRKNQTMNNLWWFSWTRRCSSYDEDSERKAKQRKTSVAWAFFEMLPTKGDEKPKNRCKKCGVVYITSGTHGTRNLKCHLKTCPIRDTRDVGQIVLG